MTAITPGHSILVVDDDPDIALGLQDLLDHDGYQVNVAGTCAEALTQAHEHQYNAVLLDLGLPDGDGSSVLRTLQEQQPQLPVIILTAYTSADRTVGSLTQGAFAYLTKPYNRDELRAVLRRAIGIQALLEGSLKHDFDLWSRPPPTPSCWRTTTVIFSPGIKPPPACSGIPMTKSEGNP